MNDTILGVIYYKSPYIRTQVTYNHFRGIYYVHLREYYLDILGEWLPTDKGVGFPANNVDFLIEQLQKVSHHQAEIQKPTNQLSLPLDDKE